MGTKYSTKNNGEVQKKRYLGKTEAQDKHKCTGPSSGSATCSNGKRRDGRRCHRCHGKGYTRTPYPIEQAYDDKNDLIGEFDVRCGNDISGKCTAPITTPNVMSAPTDIRRLFEDSVSTNQVILVLPLFFTMFFLFHR